jgi:molecular chaperone DnaK
MAKDVIRIPVYEGEYNAKGTNPELNNLIFEVVITGESLPALLPEGSNVDITIKVDKSSLMKFSAYFPLLDHTEELEIPVKTKEVPEADELTRKISDARHTARNINAANITTQLDNLENQLKNEKGSADGRMKILDGLRKVLLQLETLEKAQEWPLIEKELKDACFELEDLIEKIKSNGDTDKLNIRNIDNLLKEMKQKVDSFIREKKRAEAKKLIEEIRLFDFELRNILTGGGHDVQMLQYLHESFGQFHWKDAAKSRQLINKGLQMVAAGNRNIRPVLVEVLQLIPKNETPDDTLG